MEGDGGAILKTFCEIIPLQHLCNGGLGCEANDISRLEGIGPLAVIPDLHTIFPKDLENLILVSFHVFTYLLQSQLWTGFAHSGGIPNSSRKVTHNENGFMSQILKLPKFPQHHGEPQMDVRPRGINSQFHPKGLLLLPGEFKSLLQFLFRDDLRRPFFDSLNFFCNGHRNW